MKQIIQINYLNPDSKGINKIKRIEINYPFTNTIEENLQLFKSTVNELVQNETAKNCRVKILSEEFLEDKPLEIHNLLELESQSVLSYVKKYLSNPFLNESEKQYLQNLIKPFKDRVKSIGIYNDISYVIKGIAYHNIGREKMLIQVTNKYSTKGYDIINLPSFEQDSMYIHLRRQLDYSVEDLNL